MASYSILLSFFLVASMQLSLAQELKIQGTDLVDNQGNVVILKGVNWFGFNNRQTMLDGLWAGKDSSNMDFKTILYRLQLLGFNALRLPFGFVDFGLPPESFKKKCSVKSKSDLLSATKPKNINPAIQKPAADPPLLPDGFCNYDLPDVTTYDRFIFVVKAFADAGMYVMIDNHVRSDEDMTAHSDPKGWVNWWSKLVSDLVEDPVIKKRLIVELINEPDVTLFTWENRTVDGRQHTGLTHLYLSAMDAVYQASPTTLILIEGTGGVNTMVEGNPAQPYWGAFPTDPDLIKSKGLSDANPFFKALMTKPYLKNVLLSYHAYSTAIIPQKVPAELWVGKELTARYTQVFGYLTKKGYCATNATCHVFPMIIGEFAAPKSGNARDAQEGVSFANYFSMIGDGDDGLHTKMDNWFFWAWNENSGDTGGIATNNWQRIDFEKVQFLHDNYALKPWYCNGSNVCATVKATSSQSSAAPVAANTLTNLFIIALVLVCALFSSLDM